MSEDTMLKNSTFGGYNKRDVVQYIDALLDENEKSRKNLEQQILSLTRENIHLKDQSKFFSVKRPEPQASETPVTAVKQTKVRQTPLEKERSMDADVQEIYLPEGTYTVSKSRGITRLPNPEPVYQVREKGSVLNPADILEEDSLSTLQEDEEVSHASVSLETRLKRPVDEPVLQDVPQFSRIPVKPPVSVRGTEQPNPINAARAQNDSSESLLAAKVDALQKKVEMLEKALEAEKKEKQALAAKLEYGTDLFLQLYRVK